MSASSTYGFWLGSFFRTEKLPALLLLIGMVVTFLCIRASTRAIRRGVTWWPGNIRRGEVHVHHMVIGLPVMFIIGVLMFATQPKAPWLEVLALVFGGAAGLVFDAQGDLYLADSANDRIRMISPSGIIETVAGANGPVAGDYSGCAPAPGAS